MLIEHLQKTFAERSRRNPSYSLRAFARSLELDSSTLSALLRGKRPLTPKAAQKIIRALEIEDPALARELLLGSLGATEEASPGYAELAIEAAEVISSWEHYALLSLLETDNIRRNLRTLAKRINLPTGVVLDCLSRLEKLGLVRRRGEEWELTGKNMATPANVPNTAFREMHRQHIQMAIQSLEKDSIHVRDVSGITMAVSSAKLPEARKMIQDFRRKLAAFLEDSPRDSVYRLNVQLFPLSSEEK